MKPGASLSSLLIARAVTAVAAIGAISVETGRAQLKRAKVTEIAHALGNGIIAFSHLMDSLRKPYRHIVANADGIAAR